MSWKLSRKIKIILNFPLVYFVNGKFPIPWRDTFDGGCYLQQLAFLLSAMPSELISSSRTLFAYFVTRVTPVHFSFRRTRQRCSLKVESVWTFPQKTSENLSRNIIGSSFWPLSPSWAGGDLNPDSVPILVEKRQKWTRGDGNDNMNVGVADKLVYLKACRFFKTANFLEIISSSSI